MEISPKRSIMEGDISEAARQAGYFGDAVFSLRATSRGNV
jgi:hypothetical protein